MTLQKLGILLRRGFLVIEWLLSICTGAVMKLVPVRKRVAVAEVYSAVRFPGGWHVMGRVLGEKTLQPPTPEDWKWTNFRRMASQWFTREVPRAKVRLEVVGRVISLVCDDEGYFEYEGEGGTDEVHLSLPDLDFGMNFELHGALGDPDFVVISDVDDTLMDTGAISLGQMLKTTLFGNSLTRELVPGMADLFVRFAMLEDVPFFYVTSSPWNLAKFLRRVFARAGLPQGGLFMTDWGLTPEQWITPSHDHHKRAAIDRVLKWYPRSRVVMFGDDSQRDPEIYLSVWRDYPDRIAHLMIRSVSGEERAKQVRDSFLDVGCRVGVVVRDGVDASEVMFGEMAGREH